VKRNRWRTGGRKFIIYTIELTFIAVISAICVAGSVRAAAAASNYGPPPPAAGAAPPGGYSDVMTSQTISPAGGTVGPVTVAGGSVALVIPAGTFAVPVQITLAGPDLLAVGSAGTAGYKAVAGIGIQVQEDGAAYPGTFLKTLTLTIRSSLITSSSVVVAWNGTAFVAVPGSTLDAGAAVVSFDTDPDFAVLSPLATSATTIPGATSSVTGKPFVGEGILAGALIALGVIGLAVARRRRVRA